MMAAHAVGANAAAIRKMLDGMCVNTIVLISPIRLAIFAASHGNVSILVPVFVSCLILSWLYLKTRSQIPSFTAHAAQNILALSVVA